MVRGVHYVWDHKTGVVLAHSRGSSKRQFCEHLRMILQIFVATKKMDGTQRVTYWKDGGGHREHVLSAFPIFFLLFQPFRLDRPT